MTEPDTKARLAPFPLFVLIVGYLTLIRLAGLKLSIVDLYVDEAQYWAWSRELAFGYFSKPPLIAWTIAAADLVCGSGEACVRAASPIFYFGMGLAVYAVGRHLYDDTVAFWAGLLAVLAPGLIFSARIISTDVPLLFFWALALLAVVKLRSGGKTSWSILLAAAFGLGMLSKYAMAYFIPGLLLAAVVDRQTRALLRRPLPWLALLGGLAFLIPNMIWNIDNGLVTFRHLGDNAGGGLTLDPQEGIGFLAAQFAVAGPVVFAVLLVLIARLGTTGSLPADRFLVAFALPPLAIIAGLAFLGTSNANWAATAYVSAFVAAASALVRLGSRKALVASVILGVTIQTVLLVTDTIADRVTLPKALGGDIYRRTMGGESLGAQVAGIVAASGVRSVVTESRADAAALIYYMRDGGAAVFVWPARRPAPANHFELTRPLAETAPEPVLAIAQCPEGDRFRPFFTAVDPIVAFTVPHGPTRSSTYHAFRLTGRQAPPKAPGPCR